MIGICDVLPDFFMQSADTTMNAITSSVVNMTAQGIKTWYRRSMRTKPELSICKYKVDVCEEYSHLCTPVSYCYLLEQ